MIQRMNLAISKARVVIFVVAALYQFTFWIIDMVNGFKASAGIGVFTMFNELFSMLITLVDLAILLEVSRKIAEKYTQADFATSSPQLNYNNPNPYNAAPQAPVPPQAPVQQAAPAQPAAAAGVWYCSSCGTQNVGDAAFCAKCGKPK